MWLFRHTVPVTLCAGYRPGPGFRDKIFSAPPCRVCLVCIPAKLFFDFKRRSFEQVPQALCEIVKDRLCFSCRFFIHFDLYFSGCHFLLHFLMDDAGNLIPHLLRFFLCNSVSIIAEIFDVLIVIGIVAGHCALHLHNVPLHSGVAFIDVHVFSSC